MEGIVNTSLGTSKPVACEDLRLMLQFMERLNDEIESPPVAFTCVSLTSD